MYSPQARSKQIARLTREERLGALRLALANNKRVRVADLQGFARVVRAHMPDMARRGAPHAPSCCIWVLHMCALDGPLHVHMWERALCCSFLAGAQGLQEWHTLEPNATLR